MDKYKAQEPSSPSSDELIKTVHTISEEEIRRTKTSQCKAHTWRKIDSQNIACIHCPTALLVEDADQFLS